MTSVLICCLLGAISLLQACGNTSHSSTDASTSTPEPTQVPTAPIRVVALSVGGEAAVDLVVKPRTRFGVNQKIIASVSTRGVADAATLEARLIYQDGQTYGEQQQTISPTGPQITNFEFPRSTPWRLGHYVVEVMLDGERVVSQPIRVVEKSPAR